MPRPIDAEDLFRLTLAGDAQISPDGSSVAYVVKTLDRDKNDYVSNIYLWRDGESRQYTSGGKDSSPRWSPDGRWLAFLSGREEKGQIYLMRTDGGEPVQLTDQKLGARTPVWSPDSRKIAFVARTNVGDRLADLQMQSLQSAVAIVDVTTRQSWIAASGHQTGMQLNYNPLWVAGSASVTFTASNPVNRVLGGMPRYWSARVLGPLMQPAVSPLTPVLAHIIATS